MDINLFLKGKDCECGKHHTCDIKYVYIEENATYRLKEICKAYKKILIVADQNTYGAAGQSVSEVLGDKVFNKTIFDGDKILIPDEKAISTVEKNLDGADLIIGIGSGVIQDLCKYVSHFNKVPYIIVATAPSMDGYASSGAAMITDGMKVTYSVGLPLAIVADTNVLKQSPMEMIKAGYGDIIGKFSSLNDWKLATIVNDEYFCDYIYDITFDMVKKTMSVANGIVNRDSESIKILMEALIVVGIMISFAGNSRPASGSEHHLSHFFEITGIVKDQKYLAHGIDVAYSTVITASIREKLLNQIYDGVQFVENVSEKEQNIERLYGPVANGCNNLQEKLGTYYKNRAIIYKEKQEQVKSVLKEMPSAQEILKILQPVGYDMREFYDTYGKQKIEDAVIYAKDLKDRYTVLWMNYDINGKRPLIDAKKIKVIALDLDGTLTQHKQPLPLENKKTLDMLGEKYKLLMVGAGQVMRIHNQMENYPVDIIGNYGLQYGKYNAQTKSIELVRNEQVTCDRERAEQTVKSFRQEFNFTEFKGESVEYHPSGAITFPILGTKAELKDKLSFDPDRQKRRKIYNQVANAFKDYNVFVGGSSSFDMAPKPFDKYYALDLYCKENGYTHDEVVFVGDDYGLGGNDESVYNSDFNFLKIDNYLDFPNIVKELL